MICVLEYYISYYIYTVSMVIILLCISNMRFKIFDKNVQRSNFAIYTYYLICYKSIKLHFLNCILYNCKKLHFFHRK